MEDELTMEDRFDIAIDLLTKKQYDKYIKTIEEKEAELISF